METTISQKSLQIKGRTFSKNPVVGLIATLFLVACATLIPGFVARLGKNAERISGFIGSPMEVVNELLKLLESPLKYHKVSSVGMELTQLYAVSYGVLLYSIIHFDRVDFSKVFSTLLGFPLVILSTIPKVMPFGMVNFLNTLNWLVLEWSVAYKKTGFNSSFISKNLQSAFPIVKELNLNQVTLTHIADFFLILRTDINAIINTSASIIISEKAEVISAMVCVKKEELLIYAKELKEMGNNPDAKFSQLGHMVGSKLNSFGLSPREIINTNEVVCIMSPVGITEN